MLSKCNEETFVTSGFSDWKHATSCYKKHDISGAHHECSMKWNHHIKGVSVDTQLCSEKQKQQERNRIALEKITTSLLFLGHQGLSFRGHEEMHGNFAQLLQLRASDSEILSSWLSSSARNKWTSHDIQNEILQIMANNIVRAIVKRIHKNQFFAVIADESTDIAGKQQLSICLRYVTSKNFELHEDLIGLYEVDKADAVHLCNLLLDSFTRLNLDVHMLRGQGYDGAAVMPGARSGVATKIAAMESRAVYIHCAGHTLNLALQDAVKQIPLIRDVLDFTRELVNFVKASPKRSRLFEELQRLVSGAGQDNAGRQTSLRPLCPTRWTVRTASLSSVSTNYEALLQTLTDIAADSKDDAGAKAAGLLCKMESFDIYFALQLALLVFEPTEICSKTVQKKNISATEAKLAAATTVRLLQSMRDEDKFDDMYDECVAKGAETGVGEPKLGRKARPPRRLDDGAAAHHPATCRDKFRKCYYEFLDASVMTITDRFDNPAYDLFEEIESVLSMGAKGMELDLNAVKHICTHFGEDLQQDTLIRQISALKDICVKPADTGPARRREQAVMAVASVAGTDNVEVSVEQTEGGAGEVDSSGDDTDAAEEENIMNMSMITDCLINMGPAANLFGEIQKLVRLYYVLPASVATAERSFSAMRRLKTYLRSTMTSVRLNSVMILSVNRDLAKQLDPKEIMREFVTRNDVRKDTFGLI
jgi:Domain of unknown function (DUF4371)/hAT family C-terminal dimerisation region